jgi:hypothetical protein
MAQTPPITDAYIDEIIKASDAYNPTLNKTQGVKLRELIKLMRDIIAEQKASIFTAVLDFEADNLATHFALNSTGKVVGIVASAGIIGIRNNSVPYRYDFKTDSENGLMINFDTPPEQGKYLVDCIFTSFVPMNILPYVTLEFENYASDPVHFNIASGQDFTFNTGDTLSWDVLPGTELFFTYVSGTGYVVHFSNAGIMEQLNVYEGHNESKIIPNIPNLKISFYQLF